MKTSDNGSGWKPDLTNFRFSQKTIYHQTGHKLHKYYDNSFQRFTKRYSEKEFSIFEYDYFFFSSLPSLFTNKISQQLPSDTLTVSSIHKVTYWHFSSFAAFFLELVPLKIWHRADHCNFPHLDFTSNFLAVMKLALVHIGSKYFLQVKQFI